MLWLEEGLLSIEEPVLHVVGMNSGAPITRRCALIRCCAHGARLVSGRGGSAASRGRDREGEINFGGWPALRLRRAMGPEMRGAAISSNALRTSRGGRTIRAACHPSRGDRRSRQTHLEDHGRRPATLALRPAGERQRDAGASRRIGCRGRCLGHFPMGGRHVGETAAGWTMRAPDVSIELYGTTGTALVSGVDLASKGR